MFNFFRHRKYKKMIKAGATLLLEDFARIVNDEISTLEKDNRIKSPLHKEVLKFESTAIAFWFFRFEDLFPESLQRLTLDEVHQQYFDRLKKGGYSREQVRLICDKLNERYKLYDALFEDKETFAGIGTNFAKFVSEDSGTELDATEITIPISLMDATKVMLAEHRKIIES
jgi:hypothetical protein